MQWKTSKTGNTYTQQDDILATVLVSDGDDLTLGLKFTRPFTDESDAREFAERIIAALSDAELTRIDG